MSGYPKNAPVSTEDEVVEAFVAGSLSGRNMERDRLYEALVASGDVVFTLESILDLIRRGD